MLQKKSISKDILKLLNENQNGAFILLLKNTDAGTLKSVFQKFYNSFETHSPKDNLSDNRTTSIDIIILSLEEKKDEKGTPFLLHRQINKDSNLVDVFSFNGRLSNIEEVKRNGWKIEETDKISTGGVELELEMVAEEAASYGKKNKS